MEQENKLKVEKFTNFLRRGRPWLQHSPHRVWAREERRSPNVEIKKRLLQTEPFLVGSSHRPKTLPREPRFPNGRQDTPRGAPKHSLVGNSLARAACKAAS
jgi:hypothetical protein